MKCLSCEFEINPKWKAAIERNECPSCGQELMNLELKENLSSLRSVMDKMSEFPQELDDWMRSNYNYIKADHPDIQKALEKASGSFKVRVKTDKGEEEVVATKALSQSKTDSFFKRANAISSSEKQKFGSVEEKTGHLKKIVQQIKKSGSTSIEDDSEQLIDEDGSFEMNPSGEQASADEYSALLGDGVTSDPDEIKLQNKMAGMGTNQINMQDLLYLQRLKEKAENREDFEGSNKAKGGFSRV